MILRSTLGVVGLDTDGLTAGEAVGLPRPRQGPLAPSVEGKGGVHMGVPEEGTAKGIVQRARITWIRSRRGCVSSVGARRCGREPTDDPQPRADPLAEGPVHVKSSSQLARGAWP